ncbi:putative F-box protein At3g21120 [Chenopodium quinoa]|uniref:putative F-box protein At3g21120 n=1 Tax=Chenopodium quinoa TaxID=63459 RepID=UPI000B7961FF|nr:putative F-box protein At3g21120 [Chenopodium quinoa]
MDAPEDALLEILARQPVKSLIRFTSVCKYWLDIISSSEFATKHYATRLSQNFDEYGSLLILNPPACSISILSYKNLALETAFKFRPAVDYEQPKYDIYHRDVVYELSIHGPCNGLFLLCFTKHGIKYVLWNPATREIFKLPATGIFRVSIIGIGFDNKTNDYKVVLADVSECSDGMLLYSLAANSWRHLDAGFEFGHGCIIHRNLSSCSNGRMHNSIYSQSIDTRLCNHSKILSFDMVDEVFVLTPMPYELNYSSELINYGFLDQGSNHMYPTVYYLIDPQWVWIFGFEGVWSNRVLEQTTIYHNF